MNSEHTPLSVSLGDMPVTSDETDTVLSKSDGVTMGIFSLGRQTGKPVTNRLLLDYELQKAKERTPHWNLHVPKNPLPAGKGLVTSIMELSRFDSTIWARLDKLGYDVKPLKRLKKTNRMGMKEFLGAYFPRPLLEKLYQLAVNDGCY